MVQGILILLFMLVMMVLIITRKVPTIIALILTAIGICLLAGVPAIATDAEGNQIGFFKTVLVDGAVRLSANIMVVLFGAWLGQVMVATGITKTMIRKGAELGGDKTLVVQIILLLISSLLFTAINGLGGVIMVGSIVIPILIAVGVDQMSAAITLLLAKGVGTTISTGDVSTFASITTLDFQTVYYYSLMLSGVFLVASIALVVYRYKKCGKKFAFSETVRQEPDETAFFQIKGVLGILAMLTPVVPIVLLVAFKFEVIPALLIAIVWALLTTCWKAGWTRTMNMLVKTLYEGVNSCAPAISLMVAIGMLLVAVNEPAVATALEPFMKVVIPSTPITIALFFSILAPLCLYRGPLNLYGMGAGIAALVVGLGLMSPTAAMVGFVSVAVMQQSSCPTNTQNVWACGFVREDVTKVTVAMMPFVWPAVALMVVIGTVVYL